MRASLLGAVLGLLIYRSSGVASNFPVLCYYKHNRDAPPTRPESSMTNQEKVANLKTWIARGFKERHTSPMVDVGMVTKARYQQTARASIRDLIAICRAL